jgi:CBS domain-containing protein
MRERNVDQVMTRKVVTASADTPFKELVRLLHQHRVSGLPVVDEGGRLVGIVTEADLLGVEAEQGDEPRRRAHSLLEWLADPGRLAAVRARAEDLRARDVMVGEVVTVTPATGLRDAVRALVAAGVKRLPVVEADGRVVGIVSRRDLLAPFLRADADIRQEVAEEVVVRTMWLDPAAVEVGVERGVVTLTGRVDRRSTREVLVELVRRVDGVVGVDDRVTYTVDDR